MSELLEKKKKKLKELRLEEIKLKGRIDKLQYEVENEVFSKKKEKKPGNSPEKPEKSKKDDSGWL